MIALIRRLLGLPPRPRVDRRIVDRGRVESVKSKTERALRENENALRALDASAEITRRSTSR